MAEDFKALLEKYDKVSILTHTTADADTLGTGLGIYAVLKRFGKQVEICNLDEKLPNHLDFLPHFAKIKNQIDFDNSLIITCDAGSLDILGFDLSLKKIVNIDHHKSNTDYGALNIVNITCASASMIAYDLLKNDFEITKESATCFYVALLTDTQNFITLNVNQHVFTVASELISFGVDLKMVNKNLTQRKSLSSFRVLSETLDTLELSVDAQLASMMVTKESFERTGADIRDLVGIIDQGMALATVKIAILLIEFDDKIKVSLRSNGANVSDLAIHFGGGGHLMASGFSSRTTDLNKLLNEIKIEIQKRRLLNEL
ncbi:MAG: FIG146085: 3'-to-5' oligoribonuclease A, Bacillus type [uncultured Sulfurovum sp.]|uniref:FIG146085: 3'-to-5' oligoribonuclease A, Bacillus type n=1 Tax=uncultured Sulfurovum sp. TaxID=269237 RepID=A0A6S6TFC5_9BACT|nr:MAG: FIG146085: 3'-to-5' oligoribonuclease A, Bacillus type [uncultured Sulfurovum sp.]